LSGPSVLFIGGTGVISSACTERAIALGMEVSLLNRGKSTSRPAPADAQVLVGDANNVDSLRSAVGNREFDVVADFRAFTPSQVQSRLDVLEGRMGQYVFISSASAYQTPPGRLPVLESTPLRNPFWQYSRDKIACEDLLVQAYRDHGLPATIVRPSHTYDKTLLPMDGGWTVVDRMRRGAEVVVHGDGTSLWTLTHHRPSGTASTSPQTSGCPGTRSSRWWARPPGSNPGWCTCPLTRSPPPIRSGGPGCSATRRTR
jgi:nucleoside-diphosphate-sugar epimerase